MRPIATPATNKSGREWEEKERARVDISNVGPDKTYSKGDEEKDIEKIWQSLLQKAHKYDSSTLVNTLTDAMFCDAKFTYSETLYNQLSNSLTWSTVQIAKTNN